MPEPPGELIGVYSVEGSLTKNECGGEALPAIDPLVFEVELRHENGTGYWLQGPPPARPGTLGQDGAFRFELEQLFDVDPAARAPVDPFADPDPEALADPSAYEALDPRAGGAPCRLHIVERVEGTVRRADAPGAATPDAGVTDADAAEPDHADDADLVADNEIAISAEPGGDCGLVLRDQGGPFDALPCAAHYDLVGTKQSGQ